MTPEERSRLDVWGDATTLVHQHCTGYRPATDAELDATGSILSLSWILRIAKRTKGETAEEQPEVSP